MDRQEQTYNDIISFYDFAEDLIETVENESVADPVAQLELIEPLVGQIEEATDILAEEYRNYIKTGKRPGYMARRKLAKSLKNMYEVIGECKEINESNNNV